MLNRKIPVYEGNLPYLYACYSPEDEMLVLPILARMYNEGFRVWSACLCEKTSDFVAVRHVSTSSCVMMFMSHNMVERINSGVPEVLAACRSSLLRTVVLLDDVRPDNRFFALTAPEYLEYQRSNDSSFWLYAYSADYLERCRGPWPEIKISLREPTYEDVQEEAIAAEYISLDNIINRGSAPEAQPAEKQLYPNNRGYIQPAPDPLVYEPLEKVEPARTVHDRDYDDALALLNKCAEKQIDIIINHTRPGENTVAAVPTLSPLRPMPDQRSELEIIRMELEAAELPVERPQRRIDPQVKTKADMIVEPAQTAEAAEEQKNEPIATIPQPELTAVSIAAGIKAIADAAAQQEAAEESVEAPAVEEASDESAATVYETEKVQAEPAVEIIWDDRKPAAESAAEAEADAGRAAVQVVVRRQAPAVRVAPVRKRVVVESVQPSRTKAQAVRSAAAAARTRAAEREEAAAFEQYIRDIAIAAVSNTESTPAEQPLSHRRFGRTARAAEPPVAESAAVETAAVVAAPVAAAAAAVEPKVRAEAAAAQTQEPAAAADTAEEKASRRKNRYPHNSEVLTGLIAALRRERMSAVESTEAVVSLPEAVSSEPEHAESEEIAAAPQREETPLKVIKLSEAFSERKVDDLQAAVNKFMHLENVPDAAPLAVRAYLRRR